MSVFELQQKLYALKKERLEAIGTVTKRCSVCFMVLDNMDDDTLDAHMETHTAHINQFCPFCNMHWAALNSEMKATHIFDHEMNDVGQISIQGRRTSKVKFSPVTVERRVAYNDVNNEEAIDVDVSSLATTSPSRNGSRKTYKSTLRIDTPNRLTKGTKTQHTRQSRVPSIITSNSKRKIAGRLSVSELSNNPEIEPPRGAKKNRIPKGHPDAAWDPRRSPSSGSEHLLSPPLRLVKRYPQGHPKAAWDPRKASRSSFESLEYYTGPNGRKTFKTKKVEPRNTAQADSKGKRKRNDDDNDKHDPEEISWRPTLDEIMNTPKRRGKDKDPAYKDVTPSPATYSERPPIITRRRKTKDPTYYEHVEVTSPTPIAVHPAKRRKTKSRKEKKVPLQPQWLPKSPKERAPRNISTVSNVSSASDSRRSSAVQHPDLDVIPIPRSARSKRRASLVSSNVQGSSNSQARKRKAAPVALNRRDSDAWNEDFIPFTNGNTLFEDHNEDVLTGNPFAPPPGKKRKVESKAGSTKKSKRSKRGKRGAKVKDTKKAAALEGRHANQVAKKTTILGRPLIPPLIIAPARRFSKSSASKSESKSPASESEATGVQKAHVTDSRGRRSSAPTPSPSLASNAAPIRRTSNSTRKSTNKTFGARKTSYDVPFSEHRPMVPPNTPAVGLLDKSRDVEDKSDSETVELLDVGQLSDKIGRVKTTRGGLARELPIGVKESMLAKGKARGRAVSKATKEKEKKHPVLEDGVTTERRASSAKETQKVVQSSAVRKKTTVRRRKRMSEVEALVVMNVVEKTGRESVKRNIRQKKLQESPREED